MKHHWQFITYGLFIPFIAAIALVAGPLPSADAWQTPDLEVHAAGCQLADVSVSTTEGESHVVASNVFPVGSVIPAHAAFAVQIAGTGTIHITVTLDFPDHATAETDFTFTTCPRDTTTTSTTPSTTTTHTMNPGPPPDGASSESTGVTPKFTG